MDGMKSSAGMVWAVRALVIGAGGVALAVLFLAIWPRTPNPEAESAAIDSAEGKAGTAVVAPAETAETAQPAATVTPEVTAEAAPDVAPPQFDLVRVAADGAAVLAGVGVPGASLSVRIDGAEIIAVKIDGNGNFVAMFNLPPSDAARALSGVMILPDGREIPAEAVIAIAPTHAPDAVAAGETSQTAPAALMVTEAGANVLQGIGSAEVTAANVTVDAITYTPEGAVHLAGRGTKDANVRLYLDNAPIGETSISDEGSWSVTLSEIAPGRYTLRADQIDASGKVTSRFETPFQRESLEALAAATDQAAAASAPAQAGGADDATSPTATAAVDPAASGSGASEPQAAETQASPAPPPVQITVQPGYSLWQIARENLGDGILYVQVFEANKSQIRDPDLIYPGQIFTLPKEE